MGANDTWPGLPAKPTRHRLAWGKRKRSSLRLAEALAGGPEDRPEMRSKSEAVKFCGLNVRWGVAACACPEKTQRRVIGAQFCDDRLCSICAAARAQVFGRRLKRAIKSAEDPGRLVMLTLTVKSVPGIGPEVISGLIGDFARLRRRKLWKGIRASAWSVEFTHGEAGWHPHIHALLHVRRGAWLADQAEWSAAWSEITGGSMIVDIRPIRAGGDDSLGSALAELAKYVTKPTSLDTADLWRELWLAIRGRRLIGTTGEWRGMAEAEAAELIDQGADDLARARWEVCRDCGFRPSITLEGWIWGTTYYVEAHPDDSRLPGSRRVLFGSGPPANPRIGDLESWSVSTEFAAAAPFVTIPEPGREWGHIDPKTPKTWPDGTPYQDAEMEAWKRHHGEVGPDQRPSGADRWRARCSCGWRSAGGFGTWWAASRMLDWHTVQSRRDDQAN